ncbi:MAG: hypothetical protein ACKPKO_17400, partial [Candidatus Fonsibacter sp.]
TTYTKTEVDSLVSPKADKIYVDDQLALKANQLTTYTKTEVDTALGLKANQSSTYTKADADGLLSPKSDNTFVDAQLALKGQPANYLHQNRGRYSSRSQG